MNQIRDKIISPNRMFSQSRNAIKQTIHLFDIIIMQNSRWPPWNEHFDIAYFNHQNTTGIYLSTKASPLINSQTKITRKKYIIHPDLWTTAYVNSSFLVFQVRSLVCGQLSQHHAIEVSRTKADIAPQRGGPATVSVVQLYEQQGKLIPGGDPLLVM